jgi:hypothetical protein
MVLCTGRKNSDLRFLEDQHIELESWCGVDSCKPIAEVHVCKGANQIR